MGRFLGTISALLIALAASGSAEAAPPPRNATPVTNTDDNPMRLTLNGGLFFQQRWSESDHLTRRIHFNLEPFVAFAPVSLTIDLDTPALARADTTLFKLWFLELLSYHRNLDGNLEHDFEPVAWHTTPYEWGFGNDQYYLKLVTSFGVTLGHRWMASGQHGLYLDPYASVIASMTSLDRVFSALYLRGDRSIVARMPDYFTVGAGAQLAVALTEANLTRIVINGGYRFYQANEMAGLSPTNLYAAIGFEWGNPTPLSYSGFGIGR